MKDASPTLMGRCEALGGRALAALPARIQRRFSGRSAVRIDGQELDSGIQLLLRVMALRGSGSLISSQDATPSAERARIRREALQMTRTRTEVGAVREVHVDGALELRRARHYSPAQVGPPPLLVFVHGGGWTVCDLDTHDEACRILCHHAGVQVLSVDYRLAPEHPFPAGLEDVMAAWRWAHANAEQLGADAERVAIGGDSAGGNLSAVATYLLARDGGPVPALQILIYPGTDFVERYRSSELFGSGFFLTNANRDWCESHYLNGTGADRSDPRLSPLRAPDLSGLAPAIVVTAAFDVLRDEGEVYAASLRAAGNRVVLFRAQGLIHGFINMTSVNRASRDATIMLAGMIRAELSGRPPTTAPVSVDETVMTQR
jgi:acetyl esterase/lipase